MDQKTIITLEKIKKAKDKKEQKILEEIRSKLPPVSEYKRIAQSFL